MKTAMKNIPLFIRKDIILIAVLLIIAGGIALFGSLNSEGQTALITCDSETVTVIDLKTASDQKFTVNGTVIEVSDKEIYFSDSNCDDKTCVRTGKLKNSGDAAACVPNKVAVKISGDKENNVDIVVY